METFSASLVICAGNSPVNGEFPTQRPATRSFDVYFDLRPNKRLSKHTWFETPSLPLCRHRNGDCIQSLYRTCYFQWRNITEINQSHEEAFMSKYILYIYIYIYIYVIWRPASTGLHLLVSSCRMQAVLIWIYVVIMACPKRITNQVFWNHLRLWQLLHQTVPCDHASPTSTQRWLS